TPTPGTTPTPTPIPTPTPMAAAVPKNSAQQFLFTASMDSPLISGFVIHKDGSLSPVPGSPFVIDGPVRSLKSLHNMLIVGAEKTIITFTVEENSGVLQQTESINTSMSDLDGAISTPEQPPLSPPRVLDASSKFMYVLDNKTAEILAYRIDGEKVLALLPPSYEVFRGTAFI